MSEMTFFLLSAGGVVGLTIAGWRGSLREGAAIAALILGEAALRWLQVASRVSFANEYFGTTAGLFGAAIAVPAILSIISVQDAAVGPRRPILVRGLAVALITWLVVAVPLGMMANCNLDTRCY